MHNGWVEVGVQYKLVVKIKDVCLQNDDDEQQEPALYVGVHQKQLYIQQSGSMRHRVSSAARIFTADSASQGTSR